MYIENKLKDYLTLSIDEIENRIEGNKIVKRAILDVDEKQRCGNFELNAVIITELILTVAHTMKNKEMECKIFCLIYDFNQEMKDALFYLNQEIKIILN